MTKINFWRHLKNVFLPLTLGAAIFSLASLQGDEVIERNKCRNHRDSHRRHRDRDRCRFNQFIVRGLSKVNPSPDFLLDDATSALPDLYQPFFPVNATCNNCLSNILGQYNSFLASELYVNPGDRDNLFAFFGQDRFREIVGPRTYLSLTNAGPQLAISDDGGNTWHYSNPLLPTWLNGTLGQTTSGSYLAFLGRRTLLFAGSSDETRPIPPLAGARSFVAVTKSRDGGLTWTNPIVLATGDSGAFNIPVAGGPAVGVSVRADDIISTGRSQVVSITNVNSELNTLYGNLSYSRSRDRGNSWTPVATLYDSASDPKFVADHGYENLNVDPPIFLGGQSGFSTLVEVPGRHHRNGSDSSSDGRSSDVLLAGFIRIYPQRGTTVYEQLPTDSFFDHAVVRSFDNGRTWTQEAAVVGQYVLGSSHDPRIPGVFDLITSDGALTSAIAVSPKTGRVYYAWQGGNPVIDPDPNVYQFFPCIQLSSSADQGANWSPIVQVNRTPVNPTINGANQAFNPNVAVTDCGYVGITYEDFRNYTGGDVVQTDVWLAIYRETNNPRGGSTGVGLDFVTEVRLTAQSFDAAIGFDSRPLNGVGSVTGLATRGEQFVTTFGVTNQGNLPTSINPNFGNVQDLNNRLNVFFEKVSLRR